MNVSRDSVVTTFLGVDDSSFDFDRVHWMRWIRVMD